MNLQCVQGSTNPTSSLSWATQGQQAGIYHRLAHSEVWHRILAVSWGLSFSPCSLSTWASLSFLMALVTGFPQNKHPKRERGPDRNCFAFYNMSLIVIQCHICLQFYQLCQSESSTQVQQKGRQTKPANARVSILHFKSVGNGI